MGDDSVVGRMCGGGIRRRGRWWRRRRRKGCFEEGMVACWQWVL